MNDKLIISKYKELVEKLKECRKILSKIIYKYYPQVSATKEQKERLSELDNEISVLEIELSLLQEQEKEPSANFMQIRELTDEEWLKLPKEEILRLYKNCYSMLQNYIKLSGENIPEVKTVTSTNFESVEQSGIRVELINFLLFLENDSAKVKSIYGTYENIPVDEYLKAKER